MVGDQAVVSVQARGAQRKIGRLPGKSVAFLPSWKIGRLPSFTRAREYQKQVSWKATIDDITVLCRVCHGRLTRPRP